MIPQLTDIAILLVSLAACGYCAVLNRRLRALQSTKDGLGATIVALSNSISAVSATTDHAKHNAGDLALRLAQSIQEAEAAAKRLKAMTHALETNSHDVIERAARSKDELSAMINQAHDQSEMRVTEIVRIMREHVLQSQENLTGALKHAVDQSKVQIRELSALLQDSNAILHKTPDAPRGFDLVEVLGARNGRYED